MTDQGWRVSEKMVNQAKVTKQECETSEEIIQNEACRLLSEIDRLEGQISMQLGQIENIVQMVCFYTSMLNVTHNSKALVIVKIDIGHCVQSLTMGQLSQGAITVQVCWICDTLTFMTCLPDGFFISFFWPSNFHSCKFISVCHLIVLSLLRTFLAWMLRS